MKKFEDILVNKTGLFPDCVAINSTGAATPDGSEYVAGTINNSNHGTLQAFMDYADDGTNIPALSGTPGVPDGVIEAAGASQILEALQKGNAVGPGMYVQRAINDTPAVWGDRVLELSGQGVLVASYPDLNNATWIGGNDAAQVAAKAAGEYFWRADDAIGTTPLAAGPYLMLPGQPPFEHQYNGVTGGAAADEFTISSSVAITTLYNATAIYYETNNGVPRLNFNFGMLVASGSRTTNAVTISGVTFKTGANRIAVAGGTHTTTAYISGVFPTGGGGVITFAHASANTSIYQASGDVEIDAKPSWAIADPDKIWYITY